MRGWKERYWELRTLQDKERKDPFERWREKNDPEDIMPQVLAARCLGIAYGDPGPKLPDDVCRRCWGERYVWLGNVWGIKKQCGDCACPCHRDEVWMASHEHYDPRQLAH